MKNPTDKIEEGCFACSIWTDEADDFTFAEMEIDSFNSCQTSKRFGESLASINTTIPFSTFYL